MTAKKMTAADLRAGLKHATERMQVLRQGAIESRDTHPKHSGLWTEYHAQVRTYNLSLHVLWVNTHGEFGEDTTVGGAQ